MPSKLTDDLYALTVASYLMGTLPNCYARAFQSQIHEGLIIEVVSPFLGLNLQEDKRGIISLLQKINPDIKIHDVLSASSMAESFCREGHLMTEPARGLQAIDAFVLVNQFEAAMLENQIIEGAHVTAVQLQNESAESLYKLNQFVRYQMLRIRDREYVVRKITPGPAVWRFDVGFI